jgi:hypothetical protein
METLKENPQSSTTWLASNFCFTPRSPRSPKKTQRKNVILKNPHLSFMVFLSPNTVQWHGPGKSLNEAAR